MATYTQTAKYLLRRLTGSSNVSEVDDGIAALADDLDANMAGYADGTLAGRAGVATTAGRFYRTTDTGQVFMGTGSAWIEIGVRPWQSGDLKHSWLTIDHGDWLFCDGRAVSRATYVSLFGAIGTSVGSGDGSTSFNIPDARGCALIPPDGGTSRVTGPNARSAHGGEELHTLIDAEIPTVNVRVYNTAGGGSSVGVASRTDASNPATAADAVLGGGGAHNNMQPYLVVGGVFIHV
jgi:microcystin-dependent protein